MHSELAELAKQIASIKQAATKLKERSGGIPAAECNLDRILASIKMLEINISDIADL